MKTVTVLFVNKIVFPTAPQCVRAAQQMQREEGREREKEKRRRR